MTSLYHLSQEFQSLASIDTGEDEDFASALSDTLKAQDEMLEDKIEATIIVARQLDADADACDAEIKRLQERSKRLRANAMACKDRVLEVMSNTGKNKVSRPLFSITRAKGRSVCVIDDELALPSEYIKTKKTTSPDKAELLKALKAGTEISGAHIEDGKPSLRIS